LPRSKISLLITRNLLFGQKKLQNAV